MFFKCFPFRQFMNTCHQLHLNVQSSSNITQISTKPFRYSRVSKFIVYLISTQSLSPGGCRRTTDDVASIFFHISLSSASWLLPFYLPFYLPQGIFKLHSCPFLDVIVLYVRLSSSRSCSFHCPLENARGSWDVAIHLSFRFFSMVRKSSCTPIEVVLRCWHYLHGHPMPHT